MQPTEITRAHCVDPETLAAWVDGGLAAPAAAEVEAHLSTCARCQAVLAAFSETDIDVDADAPVAPAVVLPFWSRRPVRWAAAALAAAASITLWTLNKPERLAISDAVPDSVVVQAPAPAPSPTPPPTPMPRPSAPQASSKTVVAPEAVVATPPPPPPAPLPLNPATAVTAAREERMALSPLAELVVPPAPFEVVSASDQNAPGPATRLNTSGAGRGGGAGSPAANFAPGTTGRPPVRWRVTAATVERSIDNARTWERLDLDPPFTVTAGSAPFQNVCWLVGHDGVVFRSTNGTSFERMTPPDTVHLLAIVASDRLRATVTAVDGRIFETIDGGVTWTVRK